MELLLSDQQLWKARFDAKWRSDKKFSEFPWRSEYERFMHHVPSVETAVHEAGMVKHLSFSKNGEFFVSCTNTNRIYIWKTDPLQVLHIFREQRPLQFVEFNDTGNLILVFLLDWRAWEKSVFVYRFDPTESGENLLVIVDCWKPWLDARGFATHRVSWLDSGHYLVATNGRGSGCLIQAYSATHPRSISMNYYFEDIGCKMLLAAEVHSEGGGSQKFLIFTGSCQLNVIYIKRITDNEDSSLARPAKPDHCFTMEGPIAGIALMADRKTLIVNCRTNSDFYYRTQLDSNSCKLQIQLVDLVTLRKLTPHPLLGHVSDKNVPVSLPISSGSLIACKSSDRFVYIFDAEYSCCIGRLPHSSGIWALAWNPADAEMLITASEGKIRLWKSRNKALKDIEDGESSLTASFAKMEM